MQLDKKYIVKFRSFDGLDYRMFDRQKNATDFILELDGGVDNIELFEAEKLSFRKKIEVVDRKPE